MSEHNLEEVVLLIKEAIDIINIRNSMGDRPRLVGIEIARRHGVEACRDLLRPGMLNEDQERLIAQCWVSRKEPIEVIQEVVEEFLLGLNFLDEAKSY